MPRVIGIDPGTISLDLCGLDDGRVFLDESIPTADALANPDLILGILDRAFPLDLVVGPSGYGLPLVNIREITDSDLRLACLAPRGESGGIGGLSSLMRALAKAPVPVMVTPGVVHLASVPEHRKINRVDMGTADKVCAVALAIYQRARQQGCREQDVSLILLELGGAFTAAIAVEHGRIVDGLGGSSGPLGAAAGGALDGEVAFLAGNVTKQMIFSGGALAVAGVPDARAEELADTTTHARGDCPRRVSRERGESRRCDGRFRSFGARGGAVGTAGAGRRNPRGVGKPVVACRARRKRRRAFRFRGCGQARGAGRRSHGRRARWWNGCRPCRDAWYSGGNGHRTRSPLRHQPSNSAAAIGNRVATVHVLIVGVSTRAAAESAARAGYDVTALDAYADIDQHASVRALSLLRDFGEPFSPQAIVAAARDLPGDAVVYLSNFENHPAEVEALAAGRVLWGNASGVLRQVRDPKIARGCVRAAGHSRATSALHQKRADRANRRGREMGEQTSLVRRWSWRAAVACG